MRTSESENFITSGVNKPLWELQQKLLKDDDLRDQFHSEWRELHRNGLDMQTAIWTVRDKWLNRKSISASAN
jgi:hypothetical protein